MARSFLTEAGRGAARLSLRDIGSAFTKALISEIVGVFAASHNSQVALLGFDFDPTQFLPAMVLALLVTGGPAVSAWIQTIILDRVPKGGKWKVKPLAVRKSQLPVIRLPSDIA